MKNFMGLLLTATLIAFGCTAGAFAAGKDKPSGRNPNDVGTSYGAEVRNPQVNPYFGQGSERNEQETSGQETQIEGYFGPDGRYHPGRRAVGAMEADDSALRQVPSGNY